LGGFKPYHGLRERLAQRLGVTKSAVDHLIDARRQQPSTRRIPEPPPDFVASHTTVDGPKATLQDLFLTAAARDSERMTLFLVNGVMLQGTIAGFDQFSLVLERGGQVQLVYKHAISTLQPAHALNLGPEAAGEAESDPE